MNTRPEYRQSRTERAVRVYTIAQESRYLIIDNVPSLNLADELVKLCSSFGMVEHHSLLRINSGAKQFTEAYKIQFQAAIAARKAKRSLDDSVFYSNLLQVSYAPEDESVQDVRVKLEQRRQYISRYLEQQEQKQTKKQHLSARPFKRQKQLTSKESWEADHSIIGPQLPSHSQSVSLPLLRKDKQRRRI